MDTKKQPKSEEIAGKIKEMIVKGDQLLPGDRLPDERTMATDFGVSRTSIREAVKSLEATGYLDVKKKLGIFVAENPGLSADPLGINFMGNSSRKKLLMDWYSVRLALEPEIVRMVVESASDEEIREIANLEKKEAEAIRQGKGDFLEIDKHFHMLLAKCTHNEIMERLIPTLQRSVYYGIASEQYDRFSELVKENALIMHERIVLFLEKRDVAGSMLAMRFHLLQAISDIEEFPE